MGGWLGVVAQAVAALGLVIGLLLSFCLLLGVAISIVAIRDIDDRTQRIEEMLLRWEAEDTEVVVVDKGDTREIPTIEE